MLAFISIASRPVEYLAITSKPDTARMLQQARNLPMEHDDHNRPARFLIHDRDVKFPAAFDALLARESIKVIRTPVQAPNANAHMERWVAPSAANASTGSRSSAATSSNTSPASTSDTTTDSSLIARSTSNRPTR